MDSTMADLGEFPMYSIEGDYGSGAAPKCVVELRMEALSTSIRCKQQWWEKIEREDIVKRWQTEAETEGITGQQFELVMQKLKFIKTLMDGDIRMSSVDGVFESDGRIPVELREQLKKAVRVLEDVPDDKKDWHPGSDGLVLDLVHPSLFCLINGVSRVIKEDQQEKSWKELIGSGEPIAELPVVSKESKTYRAKHIYKHYYSKKFQWLPSDVLVDEQENARFDSYVNNIHPEENRNLVLILEKIMSRFVPMFSKVLTHLKNPWDPVIDLQGFDFYDEYDSEDDGYEDWDEYYENRVPKAIPIPDYYKAPPAISNPIDLRQRRLQIVVKLANIHLTPEKPEYSGGSWHVEGMLNERIVASGIYYYQSDNISESRLQFRQTIFEPGYEQNDSRGVREIYGLQDEDPMNQSLGYSCCVENRCLCFPNTFQHRVDPFRLLDPTKPGVRKILVFFLVDPTTHILSTKRVPPQQASWHRKEASSAVPIPDSLMQTVEEYLDFPLSLEQAKCYRDELMEERSKFLKFHNDDVYERRFSLCEH